MAGAEVEPKPPRTSTIISHVYHFPKSIEGKTKLGALVKESPRDNRERTSPSKPATIDPAAGLVTRDTAAESAQAVLFIKRQQILESCVRPFKNIHLAVFPVMIFWEPSKFPATVISCLQENAVHRYCASSVLSLR